MCHSPCRSSHHYSRHGRRRRRNNCANIYCRFALLANRLVKLLFQDPSLAICRPNPKPTQTDLPISLLFARQNDPSSSLKSPAPAIGRLRHNKIELAKCTIDILDAAEKRPFWPPHVPVPTNRVTLDSNTTASNKNTTAIAAALPQQRPPSSPPQTPPLSHRSLQELPRRAKLGLRMGLRGASTEAHAMTRLQISWRSNPSPGGRHGRRVGALVELRSIGRDWGAVVVALHEVLQLANQCRLLVL